MKKSIASGGKDLLLGKTAVVTGCSHGIGAAIIRCFAEQGANIFACIRKMTSETESFFDEIQQSCGKKVISVFMDFTDESTIKNAVREILRTKIPIDILVNNAGITCTSLFEMTPVSVFQSLFNVNFFGPVMFTQYLLKHIPEEGSIVNIASSSVFEANRGLSAYASSKAALLTWSRCLARELGQRKIRVNVVAPGVTATDILANLGQEELQKKISSNDLKRIGNPTEIANAVLFLASEKSSYITGQVFRVDGGL